jgi:hypothetical protein
MSEARVRGKPVGETAEERLRLWSMRAAGVGEHMVWVGKDYSLQQCKRDVIELLGLAALRHPAAIAFMSALGSESPSEDSPR